MALTENQKSVVKEQGRIARAALVSALELCDEEDVARPVFTQSALAMGILIMRHGMGDDESAREGINMIVDFVLGNYESFDISDLLKDSDADVENN